MEALDYQSGVFPRQMFSFTSRIFLFLSLAVLGACQTTPLVELSEPQEPRVNVDFVVTLVPQRQEAIVEILIDQANWLRKFRLNLQGVTLDQIEATGKVEYDANGLTWQPDNINARLSYRIAIAGFRKDGSTDAHINSNWALFRGEDIIPPFSITRVGKPEVSTLIQFVLPSDWFSVNTPWVKIKGGKFRVESNERSIPRPRGWVIAGNLGSRHERLGDTRITVSAPLNHEFRQMETLTFLSMIWPELTNALQVHPKKILVCGASEPMFRGGLSGPSSLYIHSDRPLVSENGTSTLIHELIHVLTGMHAVEGYDWVVEGLAEFYSVEILHRSGGMSEARKSEIFSKLAVWSKDVDRLTADKSSGKRSAKAAVLFQKLDLELRSKSGGKYDIDSFIQGLIDNKSITLDELKDIFFQLTEQSSTILAEVK